MSLLRVPGRIAASGNLELICDACSCDLGRHFNIGKDFDAGIPALEEAWLPRAEVGIAILAAEQPVRQSNLSELQLYAAAHRRARPPSAIGLSVDQSRPVGEDLVEAR